MRPGHQQSVVVGAHPWMELHVIDYSCCRTLAGDDDEDDLNPF
jgi:hypothetical protein